MKRAVPVATLLLLTACTPVGTAPLAAVGYPTPWFVYAILLMIGALLLAFVCGVVLLIRWGVRGRRSAPPPE